MQAQALDSFEQLKPAEDSLPDAHTRLAALHPISADDHSHAPYLDHVARALASMVQHSNAALAEACDQDADSAATKHNMGAFTAAKPPKIEICSYVLRLARYTGCSSATFAMALMMLQQLRSQLQVTPLTVHR